MVIPEQGAEEGTGPDVYPASGCVRVKANEEV